VLAGFLDVLVEPEQLIATAKAAATQMLSLNMIAHHGTKLRERKEMLNALDAAIKVDSTMTLSL